MGGETWLHELGEIAVGKYSHGASGIAKNRANQRDSDGAGWSIVAIGNIQLLHSNQYIYII